jgi:hypothetical protein
VVSEAQPVQYTARHIASWFQIGISFYSYHDISSERPAASAKHELLLFLQRFGDEFGECTIWTAAGHAGLAACAPAAIDAEIIEETVRQ